MSLPKPIPITVLDSQIPDVFKGFFDLAGRETINNGKLAKHHRYYSAIKFYLDNKGMDWSKLDIPPYVFQAANEIGHFVIVLKNLLVNSTKKKPIRALLRPDLIDSLYVEALVASQYLRRGYAVRWLSIWQQDPPDLSIYDMKNKVEVDVEVKTKKGKGSVETMFDSLSKGLQSLKNRKGNVSHGAIIVVYNPNDLNWKNWLNNQGVMRRLYSRLSNLEYGIVSGIVFCGGDIITRKSDGGDQYALKLVAYRSHAAIYPLPLGFLTGSGEI